MRQTQALSVPSGQNDCGRPKRMLAGYLSNIGRGPSTVRSMILSDIKRFTELGADSYASDLLRTLRLFDSAYTGAA